MSSGSASDQMKSMKIADVGNGAGGEDDVGNEETKSPAILRIYGPDQKGIVAAFAQLLHGHGCNILDSEQHASNNIFFQRICFDYATMFTDRQTLQMGISDVCKRFNMESGACHMGSITLWLFWGLFLGVSDPGPLLSVSLSLAMSFAIYTMPNFLDLNWSDRKKRVAIMVSKYDHCLWELLLRRNTGDIDCDVSVIISNHPDLKHVADTFGIPFEVYPINKQNKSEQEEIELDVLQNKYDVDLVVLARYMQIISDKFCNTFQYKVINIHHSFLPAFIGTCKMQNFISAQTANYRSSDCLGGAMHSF